MDRIALNTSFSLHSLNESSEIISEVEEIQEVHNLQKGGVKALETLNYDEALRFYQDALEIDENNIKSLEGRAQVYLNLGKYILAQLDAEKILSIQSKHSKALTLQGYALSHLNYYREALVAFLKALDLEYEDNDKCKELVDNIGQMASKYIPMPAQLAHSLPEMEPYKKLCEIGSCLVKVKRYDLAIRILNAAQKIETNQKGITMKVLQALAEAHSALNHTELAISLYQECLTTAQANHDIPYQTKSLVNIASLYQEQSETHQAIMHYEKLHDLQREILGEKFDGPLPDYWSEDLQCALHLNLSLAYKSIGNLQFAMKHAEHYLDLVQGKNVLQSNAEALSQQNIGVLYEILGKFTKAQEHFEKFLELSRMKGDKKGIAQAYGCLGGIYAKLGNAALAKTYHEQFLNAAKALKDDKLIMLSLEQFGDTYLHLGLLEEATEQYLLMFKSCSRSDPENQTKALCKVGKTYFAQKRYQYSIYYFEQAKVIADDFDLKSITSICDFNLACILQHSTQLKELDLAKKYLERLLPMLEAKVLQHLEENTFCSDELKAELHECYCAMQNVLCKLGETNLCLSYSEISKWHYLGDQVKPTFPGTGFNSWHTEHLNGIVNKQKATVLYYNLLENSYLLWVLQPEKGIVRFYQRKTTSKELNLKDEIESEINKLKSEGVKGNEHQYENRSIPYKDELLKLIRQKNSKLQLVKSESEVKATVSNSSVSSSSPGSKLFKVLLSAVYDTLADMADGSELIVVADGYLADCPFSALKDWSGRYLGDKFAITYVPNLYILDRANRNELNWLKKVDDCEYERRESRLGGVPKVMHMASMTFDPQDDLRPGYTIEPGSVDLKRLANPRLVTTGVFSPRNIRPNSSTDNFRKGPSRHIPFPPKTKPLKGPVQAATSLVRMAGMGSISTLTQRTATNTDIITCSSQIIDYKQIGDPDRCVVIGNPALPKVVKLHDAEWRPHVDLSDAHDECTNIAEIFEVTPIVGSEATKDRFMKEIQSASVIHIATRICHREGYLVFAPDVEDSEDRPPNTESYIVTTNELQSLQITAKLVVLSGGWTATNKRITHEGLKIAAAFIHAGAQCVLSIQWALPMLVLSRFYHEFYAALRVGDRVTSAVKRAQQSLRGNEHGSGYWSPWQLIGKDVTVDLLRTKQAMLHQDLTQIESEVAKSCEKAKLNLDPVTPNIANKEENLTSLQECMALLLTPCKTSPEVIDGLLFLLDGALKRLQAAENVRQVSQLPEAVAAHQGAVRLLKLLEFHFQAKGPEITDPYVIYPHWNKDNLLCASFEAVTALSDLITDTVCATALKQILPLSQSAISHLVDMLTITKNAPDIQLKITDMSVRSLWLHKRTKQALCSLGFQQIGILLKFNNIQSNRRLLSACLRLMIAVSRNKDPILLHKLDVSKLGLPENTTKKSLIRADISCLPSLKPVLLSQQQVRMSQPWMTVAEKPDEMDEKMKLARCKTLMTKELLNIVKQAKTWHQDTISQQANEALEQVGKPTPKSHKVKVIRGSALSSVYTPVDQKRELSAAQVEERRDYATFVLQQRLEGIAIRSRNEERNLYLPYIANV